MNRNLKMALCLATASMLAPAAQAQQATPRYSTLTVFGDSLLDAGQFPDTGVTGASLRFTNRVGPGYSPASGAVTGPAPGSSPRGGASIISRSSLELAMAEP